MNSGMGQKLKVVLAPGLRRLLARARLWLRLHFARPIRHRLVEYDVELLLRPGEVLDGLIREGSFEVREQWFVHDFLRPGDVFFDIGANIGLFTLIAARRAGASGHVVAFEPIPVTMRRLRMNVRMNNLANVTCASLALSDRNERREMVVYGEGRGAWASLASATPGRISGRRVVQCATLDGFRRENPGLRAPVLMKIDVEGWEVRVLEGATDTVGPETAPDLLVEFTEANAVAAGTSCRELFESLETLGYRLWRFSPQHRTLAPAFADDAFPYENLIATKSLPTLLQRCGYALAGPGVTPETEPE